MADKVIILFDGVCNFCDGFVQFLIDHDVQRKFVFSSIQSARGQELIKQHNLAHIKLTSLVVINGEITYVESTAVFYIFSLLPWPWSFIARFKWLPTVLTDTCYRAFSRNRYRWLGQSSQCRIPSPEEKSRFLD